MAFYKSLGEKQTLLLMVLLAFACKLIYLLPFTAEELTQEPFIDNDSPSYYEPAVTLAQSFQYQSYLRTPAYPAFLALIYRITGNLEPLSATNLYVIFLLQAALVSLSVVAVYLAAIRLTKSTRLSLFAGALWAIHNAATYFSARLLTDGLAAAGMAWLVYALVRAEQTQQKRWYVLEGSLLVFLVLLRPSFSLMPIVLGLAQLLTWWWQQPRQLSYRPASYELAATIFFSVFLLPALTPSAWALRNRLATGDIYYTRLSTFNFWAYAVEGAFDAAAGKPPQFSQYHHELKALLPTTSAAQMDAMYRQRIRQRLLSAPGVIARFFVINSARMLLPHSPMQGYKSALKRDFWLKRSWKTRLNYLYFLTNTLIELLTTLACLGYLGLSLFRYYDLYAALPKAFLFISLALIAYWWLVHSNANAGSRFLLPLQPLLLVACANALGVMTAPRSSRPVAET